MPKFKTGDRVEFNQNYHHHAQKGDTGVVLSTYADSDGDWLVIVKLDRTGEAMSAAFEYRLDLVAQAPVVLDSILEKVKRVSALFGKRRPLTPVMLQLQEELGELSTEVAIATGTKKRAPSEDGVAGEAVDVAIVALDIAMLELGGDVEAIKAIFERKLAKWESYK